MITKHIRHAGLPVASLLVLTVITAGCASTHQAPSATSQVEVMTLDKRPILDSNPVSQATTRSAPQRVTRVPAPSKVQLHPSAPDTHIVRKGDTLWDISGKFLKTPWQWPEIWHANPDIKNPHLIYPGDRISLYYVNGEPRLGVNMPAAGNPTDKLQPHIRARTLDDKDTGIPIQTISPFLIQPEIIPEEMLLKAAHILDSQEERLIYGAGDKVYTRGLSDQSLGTRYSVFRPGEPFFDPNTKELLGFEAIHTSDAEVIRGGEPSTVELINTSREVLRGDRLLASSIAPDDYFFVPHAPAASARGEIISVFDAISQIAGYQIAIINRGKREGVEDGHVFAVNQRGRTVKDFHHSKGQSKTVTLPEERSGLLMIFEAFEKVSYGLIMEAERPIHVGDSVTAP